MSGTWNIATMSSISCCLSVRVSSLAPCSVDTAPRFERMPDWWGSHHIKGTAAIGRLITIARDELNRENTMFFNARLKTEPKVLGAVFQVVLRAGIFLIGVAAAYSWIER